MKPYFDTHPAAVLLIVLLAWLMLPCISRLRRSRPPRSGREPPPSRPAW